MNFTLYMNYADRRREVWNNVSDLSLFKLYIVGDVGMTF